MAIKARTVRPRPEVRLQYVPWTGNWEDIPASWRASGHFQLDENGFLAIVTPHGVTHLSPDDDEVIVRGPVREFYPVPTAVFHGKYEDV